MGSRRSPVRRCSLFHVKRGAPNPLPRPAYHCARCHWGPVSRRPPIRQGRASFHVKQGLRASRWHRSRSETRGDARRRLALRRSVVSFHVKRAPLRLRPRRDHSASRVSVSDRRRRSCQTVPLRGNRQRPLARRRPLLGLRGPSSLCPQPRLCQQARLGRLTSRRWPGRLHRTSDLHQPVVHPGGSPQPSRQRALLFHVKQGPLA